jgi:hypothetical protein
MRVTNRFRSWDDLQEMDDEWDSFAEEKKAKTFKTSFSWENEIGSIEFERSELLQKTGSLHHTPNQYLIGELADTRVHDVHGNHMSVYLKEVMGAYYWCHGTSKKKIVDAILGPNSKHCHDLPANSLSCLDYDLAIKEIRRQKPKNQKRARQILQECQSHFPDENTHFLARYDTVHRTAWRPRLDTFICVSDEMWFKEVETKCS